MQVIHDPSGLFHGTGQNIRYPRQFPRIDLFPFIQKHAFSLPAKISWRPVRTSSPSWSSTATRFRSFSWARRSWEARLLKALLGLRQLFCSLPHPDLQFVPRCPKLLFHPLARGDVLRDAEPAQQLAGGVEFEVGLLAHPLYLVSPRNPVLDVIRRAAHTGLPLHVHVLAVVGMDGAQEHSS